MFPFRKIFENFKPYQSARGTMQMKNAMFLDANENPFDHQGKNRYPDPMHSELCDYIANIKTSQFSVEITEKNIVLGNGSDELIDLLIRLFVEPKEEAIAYFSPTFTMYKAYANINNVKIIDIPMRETDNDFEIDCERLFEEKIKLLFLCTPNNPTGNNIPEKKLIEIFEFYKNSNTLIVVDEAYIDYCSEKSVIKYQKKYKNIIVLHTFSKMWGLAGCRVGCMIADSEIVFQLSAIKPVYNVSILNAQAVKNQIDIKEKIYQQRNEIISQRFFLHSELEKNKDLMKIEKIFSSQANFLLIKFKENPEKIYEKFVQNNLIVRNFHSYKYLTNCIRITVGTNEENKKVIEILKNI